MKNVIESEKFQKANFELPIALGKTISNETFVMDLTKMPHLLIAGATGQGKSVGLNTILCSILYKKHPNEVKFILVDPKKVELTLYNRIENPCFTQIHYQNHLGPTSRRVNMKFRSFAQNEFIWEPIWADIASKFLKISQKLIRCSLVL